MESSERDQIVLGGLVLHQKSRDVQWADQWIRFTGKEFELLWVLASHPGKVFRRQELLEKVWGKNSRVQGRTVDAHLAKVRKKLGAASGRSCEIETLWGVGYRLRQAPL